MDVTVKTTSGYLKRAKKLIADHERDAMEDHIAARPEAHPVIRGTGGVRKARWRLPGRGKRGGVRAVYLYLARERVVYMIDMYGKAEKSDLTPADKSAIKALTSEMKKWVRER